MSFKVDNLADPCGTSLRDYVTVSYSRLAELFGEPLDAGSSDGRVSSEWIFSDDLDVCTLYDYKETELYDCSLPTVEEFRAMPEYEWHIGAKSVNSAARFKTWLLEQTGDE